MQCTCGNFGCKIRIERGLRPFCDKTFQAEEDVRAKAWRASLPPTFWTREAAEEHLAALRAAGDTRRLVVSRASVQSGNAQLWTVAPRR